MNLPTRKSTRLKNYDYSQNGYYFITICTHDKRKILCDIVGEGLCALPSTKLTDIGKIIRNSINFMEQNFENIFIEKYVIMPNHVHLLVKIQIHFRIPLKKKIQSVIFKYYTNRY